MRMRMRVLMLVKSGVTDDSRIRREASALADAGYDVTVIGDRPGPVHPIFRFVFPLGDCYLKV